jgi:hypothetical protein
MIVESLSAQGLLIENSERATIEPAAAHTQAILSFRAVKDDRSNLFTRDNSK